MSDYWGTSQADTMTGDGLDDAMFGLEGDDVISGLGGMDLIEGGDGDDILEGGDGNDILYGGAGNDVLNGGEGTDRLFGGDGDDWFVASPGLDWIEGGNGTDRLVLAGTRSDYAFLAANFGFVINSLDNSGCYYVAEVEWVYFTGDETLVRIYELTPTVATEDGEVLLGTDGDDFIEGLGGSDFLIGYDGIDTAIFAGNSTDYYFARDVGWVTVGDLIGDGGYDTMVGFEFLYFAGDDVLISVNDVPLPGGDGDDVIHGTSRMDELNGNGGDDTLIGYGGRDVFCGGPGADLLIGGLGDDDYYIEDDGDTVVEYPDEGLDSIVSWVNFTLPANVEVLFLTGAATVAIGNDIDNLLWGNWQFGSEVHGLGGDDTLLGYDGDDLLDGGAGADSLCGGGGADIFYYGAVADSTGAAPDTIEDFTPGEDVIDLGAIDADPASPADDSFVYSGSSAFSAAGAASAGELRAFAVGGGLWQVEGDVDGDGFADLVIQVVVIGTPPLAASDFIL
jgi:Ca2+-binding RTX toxin-like protein